MSAAVRDKQVVFQVPGRKRPLTDAARGANCDLRRQFVRNWAIPQTPSGRPPTHPVRLGEWFRCRRMRKTLEPQRGNTGSRPPVTALPSGSRPIFWDVAGGRSSPLLYQYRYTIELFLPLPFKTSASAAATGTCLSDQSPTASASRLYWRDHRLALACSSLWTGRKADPRATLEMFYYYFSGLGRRGTKLGGPTWRKLKPHTSPKLAPPSRPPAPAGPPLHAAHAPPRTPPSPPPRHPAPLLDTNRLSHTTPPRHYKSKVPNRNWVGSRLRNLTLKLTTSLPANRLPTPFSGRRLAGSFLRSRRTNRAVEARR